MRCPKCHYISFDAGDRCRNCGYEFSLTVGVKSLDLPIQTGDEPIGPFSDLALTDLDGSSSPGASPDAPASTRLAAAGLDLPLFKDRPVDDDAPLVTASAVPRVPLAVRKSTPPVARATARPRTEEPELDLGMPESAGYHAHPIADPEPAAGAKTVDWAAPLGRRIAAAAIDALLLGLIDAAILYLTLRLCGLQFSEVAVIPPVPGRNFGPRPTRSPRKFLPVGIIHEG